MKIFRENTILQSHNILCGKTKNITTSQNVFRKSNIIQSSSEHNMEKYYKTRSRSTIFREINSLLSNFFGTNVDLMQKKLIFP